MSINLRDPAVGKICPPWNGAHYSLKGRYFNQNGVEIDIKTGKLIGVEPEAVTKPTAPTRKELDSPGTVTAPPEQPVPAAVEPKTADEVISEPEPTKSEDEFSKEAEAILEDIENNTSPFMTVRSQARKLTGDDDISTKDDIVKAMQEILDGERQPPVAEVVAEPAEEEAPAPDPEPAPPAPTPAPTADDLDLVAWGMGSKNYLFTDVAKVIRERFHRSVTTMRDAVDTLIEEGLISEAQARKTD